MKTIPLAVAVALFACTAAQAAGGDKAGRPWELELGVGVSYEPNYSGADASSPRLLLWASGEYKTQNWGSFALDSGSLTLDPQLRWTFGDDKNYGIGLLLGYRAGRSDSDPSLIADNGSDRLRGMGSVGAAVDGGVQGWVAVFGVPVFAQLRSALGGDQGTLGVLGVYLPLELTREFTLTVLPSVTWANDKQMQALYGVTAAQSAASGFAAYSAGAGWQNAALEVDGDWKIAGPWHLVGGVAYQRLLGDAADSPLVQDKSQWSGFIGLSYRF
ncbi:MAG: MipA/OmpV family protein [Burkholderiales bacterium]|nr:MipA/OmpV family protein [Burkholderiales bacterium]